MTGCKGRGPRLTALGMQDDATGKILAAQFFPSETAFGYLSLLRQLLAPSRCAAGLLRRSQRHLCPQRRVLDSSKNSWPASVTPLSSDAPSQQLGITFIAAHIPHKPKAGSSVFGAFCRIDSPANSAWPVPTDLRSANLILQPFITDYNRRFARRRRAKPISLGVRHLTISTASAASFMSAS